jgi:hypothetical protein
MPDPVTVGSLIVWVLAKTGEAVIQGTVGEAAKNAYQALKEKIGSRAGARVEALEKAPASTAEQVALAKEVDQRPATEKEDIRILATKLIEVLENQGRSGPIGLDIETLKAVRVQLGAITVTEGTGARIKKVDTPGDFTTGPIKVGNPLGKRKR